MPGACCTRGLVCNGVKSCAHEHTGTAGALRHSLRNGLTAYAALSLETNSSCLHRCRLDGSVDPVGPNSPPTAWHQPRVSGPHGFAVRCNVGHLARCARSRITALQTRFAPDAARVHRIPSRVRDDARSAPLVGSGWRNRATDLNGRKATYFCAADWTTQITLKCLIKSQFSRNGFWGRPDAAAKQDAARLARRANHLQGVLR